MTKEVDLIIKNARLIDKENIGCSSNRVTVIVHEGKILKIATEVDEPIRYEFKKSLGC